MAGHQRYRAIPVPGLIGGNSSDALKRTWSAVVDAADKVVDVLPAVNDTDREVVRTIARALTALAGVVARGDDDDALGRLSAWTELQNLKATEPRIKAPGDPEFDSWIASANAERRAAPDRLGVAPTCRELAHRILLTWRVRNAEFTVYEQFRAEGPLPRVPEGTLLGSTVVMSGASFPTIFWDAVDPDGKVGFVPGPDLFVAVIYPLSRFDVARELAKALQPLCEPWFTPGNPEELAKAIYRTMPLRNPENPQGRAVDKTAGSRDEPFAEDHKCVIRAAFGAAGCSPADRANLFKGVE